MNKNNPGAVHRIYVLLFNAGLYKTSFPNLSDKKFLISSSVLPSLINSIIFFLISSDTGALELASDPLVHFGHLISFINYKTFPHLLYFQNYIKNHPKHLLRI